ncbi:SLC13 family permease [Bacillus atrophaeus]|uniref:GntT/GntP/DsdX family permease n=1 Tax=Bacillus atrophaeus TaxID=1452 RepID=UPI0007933701|nr:hypothetical protein B4144_2994 [Bacillus atrophaeus]
MDLNKIVLSIETGIGGQLGHLALVFGFGAMIGKLVSDAGRGYRIAITLINKFGRRKIQFAAVIASFIIGIALFFEVGLVLLIPIIYAISRELKVPFLYLHPDGSCVKCDSRVLPAASGSYRNLGCICANIGQVGYLLHQLGCQNRFWCRS